MTDITPIIKCIITLVFLLCGAFAVPYLKARVSAEKLAKAMKYVSIAVQAAEQIITTAGMGSAKKKFVRDWLELQGITYDDDMIDTMIESAVYELINKFRTEQQIETLATPDQ